ncbi:phage portal protein [Sporosarcina sp. ANT_H38]|uniref:phage tail assembly chaperone n=1 Tax=Sporosarcina sp. ANT_H38 TaxID=2597358 RepID=UPI0011F2B2B2|nr:phage portal protein [Sporosarcina sp. ANT_H38]KAA0944071.1 phage portal protein [Sporosarcina sp. ANT_H38]
MSKLKSFLKGNVKQIENASLKLERFDEAIILRSLESREGDVISDQSFKNKPGKKGKQERVFDAIKYNRDICVASIVHPDLGDVELQESYGVRGADNLYSVMFSLGEANHILEKVTELSGLDEDINDHIDEVKN